jgi:hypothetical protein
VFNPDMAILFIPEMIHLVSGRKPLNEVSWFDELTMNVIFSIVLLILILSKYRMFNRFRSDTIQEIVIRQTKMSG